VKIVSNLNQSAMAVFFLVTRDQINEKAAYHTTSDIISIGQGPPRGTDY